MHYYFEDKFALFNAGIRSPRPRDKRAPHEGAGPVRNGCGRLKADGGRGALHVFLDTDFDLYIQGGDGWRNYGAFGSQLSSTPEWCCELFDQHFDPVVLRLLGILRAKALPDVRRSRHLLGAITS